MNDTDKVIIALGFFAVVGFLAYCVLTTVRGGGSVVLSDQPQYVTVAELKAARDSGGRK